ncbi:MAG: 8-amino-7-oxononanoate synthase [Chlamydiota bacterium]
MSVWDFVDQELQECEKNHLKKPLIFQRRNLQQIEIIVDGKSAIDFTSNNYLGLAGHPTLKKRAEEFLNLYGTGSASSRLISGNLDCYDAIEKKIALLKKTEAALIFSSGYQANCSVLPTLADRHSLLLLDRLCHSSLAQGAKLSGGSVVRFRHNDTSHLHQLLKKHTSKKNYSRILIISESIFSMDGDGAPIDELIQLAEKFHCLLYLDEAHATGVLGHNGMGLSVGRKGLHITMGTFSKALGSYGAYVACSSSLKDYLVNFCKGFIYTTALPPPVLGSMDAALDLIPSMDQERKMLQKQSAKLRKILQDQGWNTGASSSQIIPIITKQEETTLDLCENLLKKQIYTVAIRPPSVPKGQCRIRFSLTTLHTEEHLSHLIRTMEELSHIYLC